MQANTTQNTKHKTQYTKHKTQKKYNNQHEPPLPYPPAALPSINMATSAMSSNQGTEAPCESVAGAWWWVHARISPQCYFVWGADAYPIEK